jgi:hypothetical protein
MTGKKMLPENEKVPASPTCDSRDDARVFHRRVSRARVRIEPSLPRAAREHIRADISIGMLLCRGNRKAGRPDAEITHFD